MHMERNVQKNLGELRNTAIAAPTETPSADALAWFIVYFDTSDTICVKQSTKCKCEGFCKDLSVFLKPWQSGDTFWREILIFLHQSSNCGNFASLFHVLVHDWLMMHTSHSLRLSASHSLSASHNSSWYEIGELNVAELVAAAAQPRLCSEGWGQWALGSGRAP